MTRPRTPSAPLTLDGSGLIRALEGAAEALEQQAASLNAINVFPVPDGDTGTNMSMTMRAAVDAARADEGIDFAAVAKAAADGALMGAKGNSGVILSQIIAGFAAQHAAALDPAALARSLQAGRDMAYRVVSEPREGTILTVASSAAEAARERVGAADDLTDVLAATVAAAHDAVQRTPDLLPVLREAGVVDAGAQGLYVALAGMLRALRGDGTIVEAERLGTIDTSWLAARQGAHDGSTEPGFCTEFVVHGESLDADAVRGRLATMGNSVLVVGDGDVLRAHVHTAHPEQAFAYARTLGELVQQRAQNMAPQVESLSSDRPAVALAVVAVGAGAGIQSLLQDAGATQVVSGGQTMNPSAGEIRRAIEQTGARDVIVLPNNKNVVLAAEQAARDLTQRVHVLPSRSIPQGVASLLAMSPDATIEQNLRAMREAVTSVHTAEVTRAARESRLDGTSIAQGQPIGLVDGDLAVVEASVAAAARRCVELMLDGRDDALVTLYAGEGEDESSSADLARMIEEEFGVEVEVVQGGQPHYPYLVGVE